MSVHTTIFLGNHGTCVAVDQCVAIADSFGLGGLLGETHVFFMSGSGWESVAAFQEVESEVVVGDVDYHDGWGAVAAAASLGPFQVAANGVENNVAVHVRPNEDNASVHAEADDDATGIVKPVAVRRPRGRPKKRAASVPAETLAGLSVCDASNLGESVGRDCAELACSNEWRQLDWQALALPTNAVRDALVQVTAVKAVNGFTLFPVCGQAMLYGCKEAAQYSTAGEDEYDKLHSYHLNSGKQFKHASFQVQAQTLGVSVKMLPGKLARLASAQNVFLRLSRHWLEKSLSEGRAVKLVSFCESLTWDETPLKASLKGWSSKEVPAHDSIAKLQSSMRQDSTICKILQSQLGYAFVLKLPDDRLLKIIGYQTAPLQVLSRASGAVLAEALQRASCASAYTRGCDFQSLIGSADKAAYNAIGLHSLAAARGVCPTLELSCKVHATSRAFGATLDGLLSSHVTGMISCGLSLRLSGSLDIFRTSMREVIAENLVVLHGTLAEDAIVYKQQMCRLMMGQSKTLSQMVLLKHLPNGDWRDEAVQHIVPPGTPPLSPEQQGALVKCMETGIVHALVGKRPKIFARHRWTGCELACEEVGLMEAIHKLFSRSFRRMLVKLHKAEGAPQASADNAVHQDVAAGWPQADANVLEPAVDDDKEVLLQQDMNAGNTDEAAKHLAEQNASLRKKSDKWLATNPLDFLVLARSAMEPLGNRGESQGN
eukprot:4017824-Amphidinium_carterae.1